MPIYVLDNGDYDEDHQIEFLELDYDLAQTMAIVAAMSSWYSWSLKASFIKGDFCALKPLGEREFAQAYSHYFIYDSGLLKEKAKTLPKTFLRTILRVAVAKCRPESSVDRKSFDDRQKAIKTQLKELLDE